MLEALLRRLPLQRLGLGDGTSGMARGALIAFAISVGGSGIGLLNHAILSRMLGPDEYGLYSLATSSMAVILLLVKFDFDTAAPRFIGGYNGQQQTGRIRAFATYAIRWILQASALALLLAIVLLAFDLAPLPANSRRALLFGALVVLPTALICLYQNALQAMHATAAAQLPSTVVRPIVLLVLLLLIRSLGVTRDAAAAVLANLIAAAVAAWLLHRAWQQHAPQDTSGLPLPEAEPTLWRRTAQGLFVISVAQTILSATTDILIIGSMLSEADAGRYALASQLSLLISMPASAVITVVTPMISRHFYAGDTERLQRVLTGASRAMAVCALPGILGLVVLGRWLLGLFGQGYESGYPVLVVMSLNSLNGVLGGGLAGFVLTMTGRHRQASVIIITCSIVYLLLVYPMTKSYGAVGTATASLIAFALRSALLMISIKRDLKVSVHPF